MLNLTKQERAQIYLELLAVLKVDGNPQNESERARSAFAEAVANHSDDPDTPLEVILAAANAVQYEIDRAVHASACDYAEFDLDSLMEATVLNRSTAILVLKLNGARVNGSKWTTAPGSETSVCVVFPNDLMREY